MRGILRLRKPIRFANRFATLRMTNDLACSAFVDFAAMTNANDDNDELFVFHRADDAVVADPVLPIVAQSSVKAFTDQSRVLEACDSLVEKL